MFRQIYAKIRERTGGEDDGDGETMYYDKEWAMVRRVDDGAQRRSTYCASPIILNREQRKKLVKQLEI